MNIRQRFFFLNYFRCFYLNGVGKLIRLINTLIYIFWYFFCTYQLNHLYCVNTSSCSWSWFTLTMINHYCYLESSTKNLKQIFKCYRQYQELLMAIHDLQSFLYLNLLLIAVDYFLLLCNATIFINPFIIYFRSVNLTRYFFPY